MGQAKMSKKCPKSRKDGDLGHPFIMGASSDAFFVMRAEKSAILADLILAFLPVR
jgi:hypothetical protein